MASESSEKSTLKEASTTGQSKRLTPKHNFEGHENAIWSFVFLHDNDHIVSGSWDGTMRKWNCDTGRLVGKPWREVGGIIRALVLSPDGKTIACGRDDGSVQRWNTDGEMIKGVWTGHSERVRSLSWSPGGDYIASGSDDETILIRKTESGKLEVGPIKTEHDYVGALAYSPSGDRIASGGSDKTICIWDSKTGKLVVGPIEGLGLSVTSVTWSSDSTKLYTASDNFARIFDSTSGKQLHRFEHDYTLYSAALSPTNNALVCVGVHGITKLWDTESHQPLGQPFPQDRETLCCVSFSPDGRYIVYGGDDKKLTLWVVKDIAPELATPILQQGDRRTYTAGSSTGIPIIVADATRPSGGNDITEEVHDDPYHNFFQSSQASLPLASPGFPHPPDLSSVRRLWNVISRHRPPANESTLEECTKRSFFRRRAHSKPPVQPTTTTPKQATQEGKVLVGEQVEEIDQNANCSANAPLGASKGTNDKGKQCGEAPADSHTPLPGDPTEVDSEENGHLWKRLMRPRGNDIASAKMTPATKRP
ncbi:WD40-repeat-containing domain protein [Suillus ampliporus]|nr:WD40-repeat-containing domain protein [Suillus ampliporus]